MNTNRHGRAAELPKPPKPTREDIDRALEEAQILRLEESDTRPGLLGFLRKARRSAEA
jgi:hypothetical protein